MSRLFSGVKQKKVFIGAKTARTKIPIKFGEINVNTERFERETGPF